MKISCVVCCAGPDNADMFTMPVPGCNHQYCSSCSDELIKAKRFPPLICCEDNLAKEKAKLMKDLKGKEEKPGKEGRVAEKGDKAGRDRLLNKEVVSEFHARLQELRTASRHKIQLFTEEAKRLLQEGHWKEAAYAVAKRIMQAQQEEKIGAWCLLDSIMRNVEGKQYYKEFSWHLPKLAARAIPTNSEGRQQFFRIAERWRRDGLFPADVLKAVKQLQLQRKT